MVVRRRPRSQRASLRGWCARARHLAFALRGGPWFVLRRVVAVARRRARWAVVTAWLLDLAQYHANRCVTCPARYVAHHERWSAFYLAAFDALVYGYADRRDEAARLARGPS